MATVQPSYKGVTPPISQSMPTAAELAANDALIEELKSENNFESPAETERRYPSSQLTCHVLTHSQDQSAANVAEGDYGLCQGDDVEEGQVLTVSD